MNTRIKQIVDYKQMSLAQFAEVIEVSRSSLTHIFSGRNQPSLDVARKILTAFPDISPEWLIMGGGKMLTSGEEVRSTSNITEKIERNKRKNEPQSLLYPLFPDDELETEIENADEEHETENLIDVISEQEDTGTAMKYAPVSGRQKSKNHDQQSGKRKIGDSQHVKKVVKVLFFFDDMTFTVYYPDKSKQA